MSRMVVAGLGILLITSSAQAEPEFPAAIQAAAGMPCGPPCTLCHTSSPGTAQTAKKEFAFTVIKNGLVPNHPESLTAVVANLRADKTDTDGDQIIDVDELAAGSDPSNPRPNADMCGPLYGCAGGRIAKVPPRPADRAPWLFASALALLLLRSRRRARAAR
jgi:hypothetical protein